MRGRPGPNVPFLPWSVQHWMYLSVSSRTPDVGPYDWKTNTGLMYSYFSYGVAVSEVEIDTLTGGHTVSAPGMVHAILYVTVTPSSLARGGKSTNPTPVRAHAILFVTVTPSSLARVGSSTTPPLAGLMSSCVLLSHHPH